jgi:hypothetical protein
MADVEISNLDLVRIKQEIKMSEKYLEQELTPIIQENLERYTGHFIPGMAQDWDIVLNEFYPIIQYNLPSIFFRNPRVFLKPRQKTFIAKRRNPLSGVMEEVQMDSGESAKTQEITFSRKSSIRGRFAAVYLMPSLCPMPSSGMATRVTSA